VVALAIVFASGLAAPPAEAIAIVGATVIDGTGAKPAARTVLVREGRIVAVGSEKSVTFPAGTRVVDGHGKWLIPGLNDMHVHYQDLPQFLSLSVGNGVTGVRDMFGQLAQIRKWSAEIADGRRVGPRYLAAAGRILDGPKPVWPGSIAVSNAEEGRKAVELVQKEGSDFVKVYSLLPRDAYFAIAKEARRRHLPFAGHVPESVTAIEASNAGQHSFEHLYSILRGCSGVEDEVTREWNAQVAAGNGTMSAFVTRARKIAPLVDGSYDVNKARKLFGILARNRTWQCPTLKVLQPGLVELEDYKEDPRWAALGKISGVVFMWARVRPFMKPSSEEARISGEARYQRLLGAVGDMRKAGVPFMVGTDTPNPYCYPGAGVHEEMALLVKAGFTPMEALQAATSNAAAFLGQAHDFGTVQPGRRADLVLLTADPLADIHNTTRIDSVICAGRFYDRGALDELLAHPQTNF